MDGERTRSYSETTKSGTLRVVVFWDGGYVTKELAPGARVVVGRGDGSDVKVGHSSISRTHLVVHTDDAGARIEDLGSFNGTRRGDTRLPPNEPVKVREGELLRFGAATLVVQRARGGVVTGSSVDVCAGEPSAAVLSTAYPGILELVAQSPIAVLLVGETGAGKELTTERIHALSPRAKAPLVKINCAALPEPLLESELFGHEKGAFTGAMHAKAGLIESADGGTLFLDEIGEMPLTTQAKLLRVLENGEVLRIGSLRPHTVDVRLVSATNRDVESMLALRTLREDLYFRIGGITLVVPPLRERRGEIRGLVAELAARAATKLGRDAARFSERALVTLEAYAWPGNVRELRNVVDRAVLLCRSAEVLPEHLALAARKADAAPVRLTTPPSRAITALPDELSALERQRICDTLERTGGNQSRAAELLGMSRRALVRRLDDYGVPRPRKG